MPDDKASFRKLIVFDGEDWATIQRAVANSHMLASRLIREGALMLADQINKEYRNERNDND